MDLKNFEMTKKQWIILGVLIVFVIIVVVFGVSQNKKTEEQPIQQEEVPTDVSATGTKRVEFIPEVPKNATATVPKEQYVVGGSDSSFGVYDINISKAGFSQTNLTVKKSDFVKVKITGVDGEYDFSIPQYGTYVSVQKGETKQVTFIPDTIGTFLFECRDKCPGGQKISGKFIVLPKQ